MKCNLHAQNMRVVLSRHLKLHLIKRISSCKNRAAPVHISFKGTSNTTTPLRAGVHMQSPQNTTSGPHWTLFQCGKCVFVKHLDDGEQQAHFFALKNRLRQNAGPHRSIPQTHPSFLFALYTWPYVPRPTLHPSYSKRSSTRSLSPVSFTLKS